MRRGNRRHSWPTFRHVDLFVSGVVGLWTCERKRGSIAGTAARDTGRGAEISSNQAIIKAEGSVSITLTQEQQKVIEQAIQAGLVRSVDEFIDSAMGALSSRNGG